MNKRERRLFGAACFFAGMVAGFLIAPIKKGINCGNNNGTKLKKVEEEFEED